MALARLKPVNKRRGYRLRRLTLLSTKKRYHAEKWYLVDESEADILRDMGQNGRTREENIEAGEEHIPAFDVAGGAAEAREIERGYRKVARRNEPEGGTIGSPVRVHRPGKKTSKPRTRRRKSAEEKPARPGKKDPDAELDTGDDDVDSKPEETADELVERRKSEIDFMVENNSADALREKATELELKKSGDKTELASRIWDHVNGGADLEDDEDDAE